MRKYYCDKVVWPLTQHRPLWILWLNSAFKLQAVLISDLQRPHHNTKALLQILATFWFKNKSLIPIFYILVNAFIHWTTLLAIPAAVRSFSLQEEGTTRNPLQDELEGMAGMKQGKKSASMSLSKSLLWWYSPFGEVQLSLFLHSGLSIST